MKSTERTSIIHLRPSIGVGVFAGNVAIVGQTGSGKSTYLDNLLKYFVYRRIEDLNFIETNNDQRDTVYDSRIKTITIPFAGPTKEQIRKVVSVLMRMKDIVDAGGDSKPHIVVIDEFSPNVNACFKGEIPGISADEKYPLTKFIDLLVAKGSERMGISFITTTFQLVDEHTIETTTSTSVIRLDRKNGIFAGNMVIGHGTGSGYTTYIESLSKFCLFGKTEEVLFLSAGPDEGEAGRLDSRIRFAIAEEGEDNTGATELLSHVFSTLDDDKRRVLFIDGIDTINRAFIGTNTPPFSIDKESTTPVDDLIDFLSANNSETRGLSIIAVGHESSPYPKLASDSVYDRSKIIFKFDDLFTRLGFMHSHIEKVRKSKHFPVLAATVWCMFRCYQLGLFSSTKLDILVVPEYSVFGEGEVPEMDRMIYSNIGSLVKPEYRFILDVINERLVGKSKYSPDTSEEDYKWFQSTFSGIMEEAYEKLIA